MAEETPEQTIEKLKGESEYYRNKFIEFKTKFIDLERSTLRYKITTKIDSVMSFLVVMLSAEEGMSFSKRMMSFISTLYMWAKRGFKLEDEQTAKARLAICNACPEIRKPNYQCSICGCLMKNKTKISGASCPLKKW